MMILISIIQQRLHRAKVERENATTVSEYVLLLHLSIILISYTCIDGHPYNLFL